MNSQVLSIDIFEKHYAAFLSCPFNPEIYDAAMGICNIKEVVNCAKLFGADEYLKSKQVDVCNKIARNGNYGEKEIGNHRFCLKIS